MPSYSVPIVKRELRALWSEYWDRKEPTKRAKKANRRAELGQTTLVTAKNKNEAAKKAEAENPGYIAIRDAISRIGR